MLKLFLMLSLAASTMAQQLPLKILRIGDSNTSGYCSGNDFKNLMESAGLEWVAQGSTNAWNHIGDYNLNEGWGGKPIQFFTEYQSDLGEVPIDRILSDYSADFIFLMIGTNNMSRIASIDSADLYQKMLNLLRKIDQGTPPQTQIIVSTIMATTSETRTRVSNEFNQKVVIPLVESMGARYHLVDAYSLINPLTEFIDEVHVNSTGARKLNQMWFDKMQDILESDDANNNEDPLECLAVKASTDDGNIANNVLDQDLSTRWSALGIGNYVEFCFESPQMYYGLNIAFYVGNTRVNYFEVDYLYNDEWIPILTNQSSSGQSLQAETFMFAEPQTMSKLRITGLGNSFNDWNSFTEVSFIEQQAPVPIEQAISREHKGIQNQVFQITPEGDLFYGAVPSTGSSFWVLRGVAGQQLQSFNLSSQGGVIPISYLPSGVYILSSGHIQHRIVKH
jgi:lysophospholipase L1-like esterase